MEDDLGVFTKEARLFFEQNATDIQTVRVGNQKESLSRSMALSSRVITPNWEEGQSVRRGAISSLEVPLTGDVYVKSYYSRVQDGVRQGGLSNVETKLVIQKHDELEEMRSFVVTIITDRRHEIMHAQSSQTCSFLNPKEFSGLMIVSDLEGNYLDAFQFTEGKQQRVALARASGMEEKDIDPASVSSTFTLMDANSAGIYTRSGEAGGWTPVPPGDIPEVTVTYCSTCHLPIEQCPGHRITPPPVAPPQWYCPKCGSFVCPGNCQTGGSSSGGSVPSSDYRGALSKRVFSDKSNLTKEQWEKVEEVLNNINADCMGGKLIGALNNKNILFVYDNKISSGKYNHRENKLTMPNFDDPNKSGKFEGLLLHELLHSQQIDNNNSRLNLEIEVYFAVYRYAKRTHRVVLTSSMYNNMHSLELTLDAHYNITDGFFNGIYEDVIADLRANDLYKDPNIYPESVAARNFKTAQKLSVDCKN